jgi:hypothetical protein
MFPEGGKLKPVVKGMDQFLIGHRKFSFLVNLNIMKELTTGVKQKASGTIGEALGPVSR